MECIPVHTTILKPPQDDLLRILNESLPPLEDGDVVVISSKVVAIDEGCCVPKADVDKTALVAEHADILIPRAYWPSPLTVVHSAFIGTSGIDESNSGEYYVALPPDPFASAERLHTHISERHNVTDLGVIITDSHTQPLRRGACGISIGFWGFKPTESHVGKEDLFGRPLEIEVSNVVDGLAAAANVLMGEAAEGIPVVVIRKAPNLTFVGGNHKDASYLNFSDDVYRVLYERFIG